MTAADIGKKGPGDIALQKGIERLDDYWRPPAQPHYIFLATSFEDENQQRVQTVQQVIRQVTAMPCMIGDGIRENNNALPQIISKQISQALMVIADISENNLNTCIEAGIARGANRRLHLIAQGKRDAPKPFMLRDQQIEYFTDDLELLGKIHQIAYPYRRRVLNSELPK